MHAKVDRAAAVELQQAARGAATFIRLWRHQIALRVAAGFAPGSAKAESLSRCDEVLSRLESAVDDLGPIEAIP